MNKKLVDRLMGLKKTGLFDIFGSSVIVKVIGFLSSIVLVRLVSKEQYGVFTVSWNIYSIAMLASGLGAMYSMLQMASENNRDAIKKTAIYSYSWKYGLMSSFIICGIIILLGLFFPFSVKGANKLMLIMGMLPVFQFCVEYQSTYFRTERLNRLFSISNIVNVGMVLLFSVIGALIFNEKGFIFGRYIAYAILAVIGWLIWKVPAEFNKSSLQKKDKRDFSHIAWVSMTIAGISQLLYLIDVLVLGIVVPDETVVASYKVATIVPTALSFIPSALVTYIYPYFAENKDNPDWCIKKYRQLTIIIGSCNFVISSVLFAFAPFIIRIMYGSEYADALIPFRILSVSYFFSGTFKTIAGNLLVTQRKLKYNTFVAVLSGALNILLDVVLISNMGSVGAAYATLSIVILTSALNTGYLLHVLTKRKEEL